ncbi:MAG: hypothetical protein HRU40_00310 [Saprospiraceae bacterium]|nr:hypothetical protein [Saprospiraceae bacterium]
MEKGKNKKSDVREEVPFFKRPSKGVLVIFTSLWALAAFLIFAAATNAFTEPLFPLTNQFYLFFGLVLYNTFAVFILYRNYFIHQKNLRDQANKKGRR